MPRHTHACIFTALFLSVFIAAAPADALTGKEIMTNMSDKESFAYIAGSVEMAAFLAKVGGDADRSSCIMDWYFHDRNGVKQIDEALSHFKDRQAHPVIYLLIKRQCGD